VLFALISAKAEDRSFVSNGVKLRYVAQGQGTPVVLIHGMTLDVESQWDEAGTIKALAKDYQVIAFDCRGHGKSDKPHEPAAYGIEMVEDVRRLLDVLHITKAHLVGYSLGSSIALKFLTVHPERCLSVVLGEGAVYRDDYDFSAEKKAARSSALVLDPAQVRPEPPPGAP
jgi:pimeloyl-ACP methyl ester carboxylesterase